MNSKLIEKHIIATNLRRSKLRRAKMISTFQRRQANLSRLRSAVNAQAEHNQVSNRTGMLWSIAIGIGSTLIILAYVGYTI